MTTILDSHQIQRGLAELRKRKNAGIRPEAHGFNLNPPLSEKVIVQFELDHGISLPQDYRNFLASIGNGGAGPFYGVFRWVTPTALAQIWRLGRRETVLLARSACPFCCAIRGTTFLYIRRRSCFEKDEAEYEQANRKV